MWKLSRNFVDSSTAHPCSLTIASDDNAQPIALAIHDTSIIAVQKFWTSSSFANISTGDQADSWVAGTVGWCRLGHCVMCVVRDIWVILLPLLNLSWTQGRKVLGALSRQPPGQRHPANSYTDCWHWDNRSLAYFSYSPNIYTWLYLKYLAIWEQTVFVLSEMSE